MRKRHGFTLMETTISLTVLGFTLFGTMGLLIFALKSTDNTTADVKLSEPTSLALRRINDTIRRAYSVTISTDGKTLTYTLPKKMTTNDSVTGEKEFMEPLQSDGVNRVFKVQDGKLVDQTADRVLLGDILTKDPDPTSSQYDLTYKPFTLTTVGSRKAITMNFITQVKEPGSTHYRTSRMKTTVMVQNIR